MATHFIQHPTQRFSAPSKCCKDAWMLLPWVLNRLLDQQRPEKQNTRVQCCSLWFMRQKSKTKAQKQCSQLERKQMPLFQVGITLDLVLGQIRYFFHDRRSKEQEGWTWKPLGSKASSTKLLPVWMRPETHFRLQGEWTLVTKGALGTHFGTGRHTGQDHKRSWW